MFQMQTRGDWKSQKQTPEQDRRSTAIPHEKLALNWGLSNGCPAELGAVLFLLCFPWVGWGWGNYSPTIRRNDCFVQVEARRADLGIFGAGDFRSIN